MRKTDNHSRKNSGEKKQEEKPAVVEDDFDETKKTDGEHLSIKVFKLPHMRIWPS